MTISDERLKRKAFRAVSLQEQGLFIVDQQGELPLPSHPSLTNMRYSNNRDENGRYYDYETPWGKFSYDVESLRSLLVLRKGNPPQNYCRSQGLKWLLLQSMQAL